jgi:hemolysin activation/secretion protein
MRLRNILIAREVLSAGARLRREWRGRARFPDARLLVVWCFFLMAPALFAGETPDSQNSPASAPAAVEADAGPRFAVRAYAVEGVSLPSTNNLSGTLSQYTGTNVGVEEMAQAAAAVQSEYRNQGLPPMSVAVAPQQIQNGVVTMHVFQGAFPVILVSGKSYASSGIRPGVSPNAVAEVNAPASVPPAGIAAPAAATAAAAAAGAETNAAVSSAETNTPPAAVATNAVPHLEVQGYEVTGNDLLDDDVLQNVLSKYTGTNITFDQVGDALKELTLEYRDRGYETVSVMTPVQTISNGIIKIRVIEGRLATIQVSGNHYFSSNNIMRALPGLETNMILNSKLFQPQLDLANANQDRTVYPQIAPGPEPDTTALKLVVHDRLPLHAKLEVNNQSTPGTPDLRVNGSAAYNNLWQENQSIGVQYSFSPQDSKLGSQWPFFDRPQAANYSGFYRLPLGNPESEADTVEKSDGAFGYDEGSRKFNLPPPTGAPELNFYASRSTIDTKIEYGDVNTLLQTTARTVTEQSQQEDLTVNEDIGFRWSRSLREFDDIHSVLSAGVDFKRYDLQSSKTNVITFTEIFFNGVTPVEHVGVLLQPDPTVWQTVRYLPVTVRWDANRGDADGTFNFGLGYSMNFSDALFPNSQTEFQNAAGSTAATGFYDILTASLAREQILMNGWRLAVKADGQWANQPLISNEQFGVGGVNGVRGYREGEVFGDTGWRVTSELKTPPHTVGFVGAGTSRPLIVRASVFMDYAQTYLIDPVGVPGRVPLWGTGIGGGANIGSAWQGRLAFTWPLLNAGTATAGQLRIMFALSGQF